MPKIDEAQIKVALAAARDGRGESAHFARSELSKHSGIHANEREVKNLLTSFFANAGLEVDKFEKLRAKNKVDLDRVLNQRRDAAIKRSSSVSESLRSQVGSRLKASEVLPAGPQYFLLDTPLFISTTHGPFLDLVSSQVKPANSFAKIKLQSALEDGDERGERLSFFFLFQNPSDRFAITDVHAYLVANGFCDVFSRDGLIFGLRGARLDIDADLHLWEWWNNPPTEPLPQVDQSQHVLSLLCNSSGLFAGPASDFKDVFRGYDLSYNQFVIQPNAFVVLEVALSIFYLYADGGISVDFASGDFQVTCPAVLLAIVN